MSLSASASRKSSCSRSKASGSIGWLTLPHQTVFSVTALRDDEFILRGAAGELAGADDQRTVLGEQAFAAAHRMLDERRRRQIPENLGACRDTLRVKSVTWNPVTHSTNTPFQMFKAAASLGCRRIRMRRPYNPEKVARSKRHSRSIGHFGPG